MKLNKMFKEGAQCGKFTTKLPNEWEYLFSHHPELTSWALSAHEPWIHSIDISSIIIATQNAWDEHLHHSHWPKQSHKQLPLEIMSLKHQLAQAMRTNVWPVLRPADFNEWCILMHAHLAVNKLFFFIKLTWLMILCLEMKTGHSAHTRQLLEGVIYIHPSSIEA